MLIMVVIVVMLAAYGALPLWVSVRTTMALAVGQAKQTKQVKPGPSGKGRSFTKIRNTNGCMMSLVSVGLN